MVDRHSGCEDKESREFLKAAEGGRPLGTLLEGSLSMALLHWKHCQSCRDEMPYAPSALQRVKVELDERTAVEIESTLHSFLAKKHQLLAEASKRSAENAPARSVDADQETPSIYGEVLREFAACGGETKYLLGYVSEIGGLAQFRMFPDPKNDEEVYASASCAAFIRSLSVENQRLL